MLEAVHALQSRRSLTRSCTFAPQVSRLQRIRPAARSVPMDQGAPRAKRAVVNSATSTHSTSYARI
eukprot:664068-Prymnesium_polylepis.1